MNMYVSLALPAVRGAASTRPLINGSTTWGAAMLLHEVINGCRVAWQRLTSDYMGLYLCLTCGSAGRMAFLLLMDGDICLYGCEEKWLAATV